MTDSVIVLPPFRPVFWPLKVLEVHKITPTTAPFSRGGNASLDGSKRSVRTDLGFWKIQYEKVTLLDAPSRKSFTAIRQALGGRSGLAVIPVPPFDIVENLGGTSDGGYLVPFSDDSTFSDGSYWRSPSIVVENAEVVGIGATTAKLRIVAGLEDLPGMRFSYRNAMYEIGPYSDITGNVWTVAIFPSVRAPIPVNALLEFDSPKCLVHLENDDGMDGPVSAEGFDQTDVSWIEATDYWNDLAASLVVETVP